MVLKFTNHILDVPLHQLMLNRREARFCGPWQNQNKSYISLRMWWISFNFLQLQDKSRLKY